MGTRIKWDENIATSVADAIERLSEIADLPLENELLVDSEVLDNGSIEGERKIIDWIKHPVPPH
jgi:hypothetical protein